MRKNNLYELLQVIPTADTEIIQAAYRRLILRYHPDRSTEPNAAEMTQRLNNAYAILSDSARRAAYDSELRQRTSGSASGAGQTSSRTSQSRPPSGTGQTSSRASQSRPNTPPPPPKPRPPSRAPTRSRRVHVTPPLRRDSVYSPRRVECPHCKKSVIPTKGAPFNWIKFLIFGGLPWLIWGERNREKPGYCSNCGKPLPANLLEPEQRFDI
jgi:curved DNA-binding protein CbpA